MEVLYNTAVQAFVRRDHVKTLSTLQLLLKLVDERQTRTHQAWYDLGSSINGHSDGVNGAAQGESAEDWTIKILKLVISSYASLYTDPPGITTALSAEVRALLPPTPPSKMLENVLSICNAHYPHPPTASPVLLPPQVISTLLMASLKLTPAESALSFAHHLAENWLAQLPDESIRSISATPPKSGNPEQWKRLESMREAYLKVVELFVGEVLVREGEWEMAKGFLGGESVMGSRRKEVSPDSSAPEGVNSRQALFKHLRAMQNRKSNPSSPSASVMLSSTASSPASSAIISGEPVSPTPNGKIPFRQRSDSASSSSSEATARPIIEPFSISSAKTPGLVDRKGKGKAVSTASTESILPRRIEVNHSRSSSRDSTEGKGTWLSRSHTGQRLRDWVNARLLLVPEALRTRLAGLTTLQLLGVALPLPIITLVLLAIGLRRRMRRKAAAAATSGLVTAETIARLSPVAELRAVIDRIRERGLLQWLWWWCRWWMRKFYGIWVLGTTITYF